MTCWVWRAVDIRAYLDLIKRGVRLSSHYRHFFGESLRPILALLWWLDFIFLGSKIESRIWAFSMVDILISRAGSRTDLTINWWYRVSCASFCFKRWHLSQPAEGREPLEFFQKFDSSKEVSFLVYTIGTFLGNLLGIFWHYYGDFNFFCWVCYFLDWVMLIDAGWILLLGLHNTFRFCGICPWSWEPLIFKIRHLWRISWNDVTNHREYINLKLPLT